MKDVAEGCQGEVITGKSSKIVLSMLFMYPVSGFFFERLTAFEFLIFLATCLRLRVLGSRIEGFDPLCS